MKLKHWVAAAAIAAATATAWALPSVQDVETAVRSGQYAQAETMMKEVVVDKPNSAKAHYLYAEILAHNTRFAQAAEEARAAERLDPKLGFTQPEKFRAFQELLTREQRAEAAPRNATTTTGNGRAANADSYAGGTAAREAAPARSGIPGWIWIAGLAVIGYFLWRGFSKSRAAGRTMPGAMPAGYGPGVPGGYPPNPGYGPGAGPAGYGPGAPGAPGYGQPMQAGYGPGMAPQQSNRGSWVGTGVAAAGGVVAGMALDRMLHSNDGAAHAAAAPGGGGGLAGDLGQMSSFDNAGGNDAARQLEDRSIDFGNGNDWGGDAGGSFDAGGDSSSSDDGGW